MLENGHFTTISGHFFANFINSFHKEVLTVILKCSTLKILIELNISLDCAVNFLEKHKDIRISKSPNTKISKEVYDILSDEFKLKSKEDVFQYKKK